MKSPGRAAVTVRLSGAADVRLRSETSRNRHTVDAGRSSRRSLTVKAEVPAPLTIEARIERTSGRRGDHRSDAATQSHAARESV